FLKNESRRRQQRRRPRSVSGLINPPNQTSQHTLRQKTDIFIKLLILLGSFVNRSENKRKKQNLPTFRHTPNALPSGPDCK
ncbi:hypothetical protein, partial [Agrobacterium leguminum]|uniref:hypothetical protein n=1 Tax=Agrobacterium leguminum TaxID=2792015 RepID=UPI0019D5779E